MPAFYIDIHTHRDSPGTTDVISVNNILLQNASERLAVPGWYSVGLHPWDSDSLNFDQDLLIRLMDMPGLIAVGECGLDKLRGAPIPVQTEIFTKQALIAGDHDKPLIIHCVQAWQEIMAIRKDIHPKNPWIIHGFRGKPELAKQLVDQGFYLSFGDSLLSLNSPVTVSFKNIPADRFFLETDESLRPVQEIYRAAAAIKNLSLADLQSLLMNNFKTVYRTDGTSRMATTN